MKIISWNVNGLRSVIRKGFWKWLEKENPDILCLQEVKLGRSDLTFDVLYPRDYYSFFNLSCKKGYAGVLAYSKEKPLSLNKKLGMESFDEEGRFLELSFKKFKLINIYIPHGGRYKSKLEYKLGAYRKLKKRLEKLKEQKVILLGDFNVAHTELDLARPKENRNNIMFSQVERRSIDYIIRLGYVDSFRKFNKKGGNYTWWQYGNSAYEKNIGWRIDYCFVSKNLQRKLNNVFILNRVRISDHCPIGIEVDI